MLLADNLGACCSIDETSLCNEVYTIVFNKAGHGKKGSVIAIVKRTKANVVSAVLKKIPEAEEQEGTQRTQAHTQTEIQANAADQR